MCTRGSSFSYFRCYSTDAVHPSLLPIFTGFSTSSIFRDSPLVQIVVSSKDQLIQKSSNAFMDLEATSIREEEHPEGSSDEEMEIIAHFIENVEVTTAPDNANNHNRPQSLLPRTNSITQAPGGNSGDNFIKTKFLSFFTMLAFLSYISFAQ